MGENRQFDLFRRIAEALDRLAPPEREDASFEGGIAFVWTGEAIESPASFDPVPLDLLTGIDDQKSALVENTRRHAAGHAAHDVLLWGARGMGKSALVKAAVRAARSGSDAVLLVETGADKLHTLPRLFDRLAISSQRFIIFIDDVGFEEAGEEPRLLRSMLEGGVRERPDNVRLYATSNRRHIVPRNLAEQDDPVNPRDVIDDRLALSDRFGLRLGFHAASQDDYLAIVAAYAERFALDWDRDDALAWAAQRGARSGRIAWHYIVEIAGRAGRSL